MFFDPLGEGIGFVRVERVDFAIKDWWGVRFEIDGVVVHPFQGKVLGFHFREDFGVSVVFFRDGVQVSILVSFDSPFLREVGAIDDDFISFPFVSP
jgi:hypothetical protein